MGATRTGMLRKAIAQYQEIYPTVGKASFAECFSIDEGALIFWFNTGDNSTHIMVQSIGHIS